MNKNDKQSWRNRKNRRYAHKALNKVHAERRGQVWSPATENFVNTLRQRLAV